MISRQLWIEIKKFFLLHAGPYEVSEIKMENAYVLKDPQTREIKGTYNVTQLKKYYLSE